MHVDKKKVFKYTLFTLKWTCIIAWFLFLAFCKVVQFVLNTIICSAAASSSDHVNYDEGGYNVNGEFDCGRIDGEVYESDY